MKEGSKHTCGTCYRAQVGKWQQNILMNRKRKGLGTWAGVLVADKHSVKGVIPNEGDIPKSIMMQRGRIARAWIVFSRGIFFRAGCCGGHVIASTKFCECQSKLLLLTLVLHLVIQLCLLPSNDRATFSIKSPFLVDVPSGLKQKGCRLLGCCGPSPECCGASAFLDVREDNVLFQARNQTQPAIQT